MMTMDSVERWRTVVVAVNKHVSLTLGELVDGWQQHVQRFVAELDTDPHDRTTWGVHDYIGALHLRDAVERGLALLQDGEQADAIRHVTPVDRKLEEQTEPDEAALLGVFPSDSSGGSWWWHRVPTRGPIRTELGR